ncbi:HTH domain protein [Roseovarius litorisediminis]|uniref:HTH domain protein n=1 Tax=Roseovarius litorisediminis TaxID=1312363 RepID=A0A1Y5RZD7_9RHOB|nr:YafY family protein [Roseovarius litorisediminis]SLN27666.1 HTH domain protein [Roseovarius litorisediminis]
MQRTDRLFEVIDLLRRARGPMTADQIAARMELSSRTIYRYIASLQSLRIPIDGAAGVGYILRPGYDLPPLNFDATEQEALIVGMGLLARTGDAELQQAARRVLDKIETGASAAMDVSDWGIPSDPRNTGALLRRAIRDETEVEITYLSLADTQTTRRIWPLMLTYYVEVSVVSAWCHLRRDFRTFRVDRIQTLSATDARFTGQGEGLRVTMQERSTA